MFRVTIRTTAFVTALLSLGFAATGGASAFASESHRFPVAHRLTAAAYASSAPSFARSGARFVPGRGIVGESCDLPSSACSNNDRIND